MRVYGLLLLVVSQVLGQTASQPRLTGSIRDQVDAPIANASVILSSMDRVFQTSSLPDGTFDLGSVPDGVYELRVSSYGFVKQKLRMQVPREDSQSLAIVLKVGNMPDMEQSGPNSHITYLALDPCGVRLRGTVHNYLSKKPVADAEITLWEAGLQKPAFASSSGRTGSFEFNNVPAGYYTFRITRRGYWQEEIKELLLARENSVSIDSTLLKRNRIIVYQ